MMFAPESLLDGSGRRIFWTWLLDGRVRQREELGVMTAPRVLSLDDAGQLLMAPPAEFDQLRRERTSQSDVLVRAGQVLDTKISGDVMEILLTATDLPPTGRFSVLVRASPAALGRGGGGVHEQTVVTVDVSAGTLAVDTTASRAAWSPPPVTADAADATPKTDPDATRQMFPVMGAQPTPVETPCQAAPFALGTGEALALRIFLDKSVLEVYANGRQCVTARMYPGDAASVGVGLLSQQGATTVATLEAYQLASTPATH
jgi:beta-fructofuranosidase